MTYLFWTAFVAGFKLAALIAFVTWAVWYWRRHDRRAAGLVVAAPLLFFAAPAGADSIPELLRRPEPIRLAPVQPGIPDGPPAAAPAPNPKPQNHPSKRRHYKGPPVFLAPFPGMPGGLPLPNIFRLW